MRHRFRKLFNRNNVKVSYSTMTNMKGIISGHKRNNVKVSYSTMTNIKGIIIDTIEKFSRILTTKSNESAIAETQMIVL